MSLRNYQEQDVQFMLRALAAPSPVDRVAFNLNEPGLGKTVEGAAVIGRLPAERPALVVCPTGVRAAWQEELAAWAPDREVIIPEDTFSLRRPDPGQVTIVGFDQLGAMRPPKPVAAALLRDKSKKAKLADAQATHAKAIDLHRRREQSQASLRDLLPGTVLVADEVHYAKSARTARSLALEELWKDACRPRGGAYLPLSGTIDPRDPVDLWVALEVAGVALRVWPGGITACLQDHFGGRFDRLSKRWTFPAEPPGGPVTEGPVGERLRRYVIRRVQEDVLDELPAPTRLVTVCPVAGSARVLADRLLDAAVASRGEHVLTSPGELVEALARRLTTGSDLGVFSEARAALAEIKIPTLERRLFELRLRGIGIPGDPVVVCSEHRSPVDWLRRAEALASMSGPWGFITGDESKAQRDKVIDDLRAHRLAGVAITAAGGVGITLIESRYMIKVSSSWSADDEQQRERRILRFGQKRPVTIESIVADHPVEAAVLSVVSKKAARSAATWGRSRSSAESNNGRT